MKAKIWEAALVFAGVFLAAGMASASMLGSFGVISGEANVEGPTFYAGTGDSLYTEVDESGSYTVNVTGDENEVFDYDFGGERNWYDAEVQMFAKVKGISVDGEENVNLTFSVNDLEGNEFCSSSKEIPAEDYEPELEAYDEKCEFNSQSIEGFEYEVGVDSEQKARLTYQEGEQDTYVEVSTK